MKSTPNRALSKRGRRHLTYAGMAAMLGLLAGYSGVLPVFRSHLLEYLGIGDRGFGLLFSVGSIVGLVGTLFGGVMIDKWGPRRAIRITLVGFGISLLMIALAGTSFSMFIAAAAVGALFRGPMAIAVDVYLAKLFPRHQRRLISLNLASTSLGGMMFPIAAESLLRLSTTSPDVTFAQVLHIPFFVVAGLMLGCSLIYRPRTRTDGANHKGRSSGLSWRSLLLPPRALLLAVLLTLHSLCDTVLYIWMPRFLESESFDAILIPPGFVLSGFALAYFLSRVALAALPDRVGRRFFLFVPGITGGTIIVLAILSRSFLVTSIGYVLAGLIWSAEYPMFVSTVMRCDKQRFGAVMAVSGVFFGVAMFVAMNWMGALMERIGDEHMWKGMLVPAAGFILVGLIGWVWSRLYGEH